MSEPALPNPSLAQKIEPLAVLPMEDDTVATLGDVPADATPKFCSRCGVSWDPQWVDCPACARTTSKPVIPNVEVENRAIKSSIALYLSMLLVCMIGTLASSPHNALQVQFGVSAGITAVALGWCIASWRTLLPPLRTAPHVKWLAFALPMSIATFGIATGVITSLQHVMHLPKESIHDEFFDGGYGWGAIVLVFCVQPALMEELAFRGVMIGAFQKALSQFETVFVTALMFMILHLSVARFPHTLALGLAAGFLRTRSKSLYPCFLLHFAHNGLCVLVEQFFR